MAKCLFGLGLSKCKLDALPGMSHCNKHLSPEERRVWGETHQSPSAPVIPIFSRDIGLLLQQIGVSRITSKKGNARFIQDMQAYAIRIFFGDAKVYDDNEQRLWVCTDDLHRYCPIENIQVPTNASGHKIVMSAVFRQEWWVRRRCEHGADLDRLSDLVSNRNQDNGTYVLHPDRYYSVWVKKFPLHYAESKRFLANSKLPRPRSSDPQADHEGVKGGT